MPPVSEVTKDRYDIQCGTNVLVHLYLTELLMPALLAGVASSPDRHTGILTTSSSGAYMGELRYDTLKDGHARRKLAGDALYYQCKLHARSLTIIHRVVTIQTAKPYDPAVGAELRAWLEGEVKAFEASQAQAAA